MSLYKLYWKVRDTLIVLGVIPSPCLCLQRHEPGTVRSRLVGRGTRKRTRRLSLPELLRSR